MQIIRDNIETMVGPNEWFTGTVCVDTFTTPFFAREILARVSSGIIDQRFDEHPV